MGTATICHQLFATLNFCNRIGIVTAYSTMKLEKCDSCSHICTWGHKYQERWIPRSHLSWTPYIGCKGSGIVRWRSKEGKLIRSSTWHLTTHTAVRGDRYFQPTTHGAVKHDNTKACGNVFGTQCVSNWQLIYKWSSNSLTIITSITHEPIWYQKTDFWEFCMFRPGGSLNHHIATPMSHWRPNHRAGLAITSHNGRSP